MNEKLIKLLSDRRAQLKLTQKSVAADLNVKQNTISNWETGRTSPDLESFLGLCRLYGLDFASILREYYNIPGEQDSCSKDECSLLRIYRRLSDADRKLLKSIAKRFSKAGENPAEGLPRRVLPYYNMKRFPENKSVFYRSRELLLTGSDLPEDGTLFGVLILGDDLEPAYSDHDLLLIDPASAPPDGKAGLYRTGEHISLRILKSGSLLSPNPEYPPVPLDENSRCIGQVVMRTKAGEL